MKLEWLPSATSINNAVFEDPLWVSRQVTYNDATSVDGQWEEKTWTRSIRVLNFGAAAVFEQIRARLLSLDIISPTRLQYGGQWLYEDRLPQVHDLVFQRTHLISIGKRVIVDVLSAVRVGDVTNDSNEFALTLITTNGHPVQGYSRFAITVQHDGVAFSIHSVSRPATTISSLLKPITRRTQHSISTAILNYVETATRLDLTGDPA